MPTTSSPVATRVPLTHTSARKLIPSNASHVRTPVGAAGTSTSVRHHQAGRYGLSSGMGRNDHVQPGTDCRFVPNSASPSRPASYSAPATVPGARAAIHAASSKPGTEMAAPSSPTCADDAMRQEARSTAPCSSGLSGAPPSQAVCASRNEANAIITRRAKAGLRACRRPDYRIATAGSRFCGSLCHFERRTRQKTGRGSDGRSGTPATTRESPRDPRAGRPGQAGSSRGAAASRVAAYGTSAGTSAPRTLPMIGTPLP